MSDSAGQVFVGVMMGLLGLLGLKMASGALDNEIYIFGMGLFILAILFDFGLIRRHYDRIDAVRHHGGGQ